MSVGDIGASDVARFLSYALPEPNSGCWIWTGGGQRYGAFWHAGKLIGAHVFACEAFNGEMQSGTQVDHLCRTTVCVNPSHLEAVTSSVNQLRKPAPRNQYSGKRYCKRGHELSGANLYIRHKTGQRVCKTCRNETLRKLKERRRGFI